MSFAEMAGIDAVLIQLDPLTMNQRRHIADLAARHRLPAIYENRSYALDDGLISYGPNNRENFHLGASYTDRILRGARPRDLPVEQPSRLELVINLNAAKA